MWKFLNVFKLKTISVPARNIHKYTFKMNKAYLRHASDSNYFQITFHYKNLDLKVDRQFNFQRQLNETVGTFIGRVETNLEKATAKKKKGKAKAVVVEKYLEAKNVKGNNEEAVKEGYGNETNKVQKMNENEQNSFLILFYVNGKPIEDTLICSELFKEDKEVTFKINESEYKVIINSPWIETISLPTSILANFPVYPIKYESVNAEQSLSDFIWFKSNDKKTWSEIGKGFIHVTNNEDINNYLKLIAIPKNEKFEGPRVECESSVKVEASPGECPFEKRHKFCQNHLAQAEFRVVSYNILADLYCDSDFTRTVLFPYCPAYALGIDYRKQLILKELIGYNSDLICLQEVDKKVFVYDLNPVLSNYGYESIFNLKGGLVAEGLACFFRTDRFVLLESNSFELSKELYRNSIYKDIWDAVSKNMKLRDRLIDRTSALQCVVLQSKDIEGEILVVANTHLYFHPDADHIRLLQGGICIRFIQHLVDDLKNRVCYFLFYIIFILGKFPSCIILYVFCLFHLFLFLLFHFYTFFYSFNFLV